MTLIGKIMYSEETPWKQSVDEQKQSDPRRIPRCIRSPVPARVERLNAQVSGWVRFTSRLAVAGCRLQHYRLNYPSFAEG